MKKLLTLPALALTLAACAPAVTAEKPITETREFKATCAQALDAVALTAPRIRLPDALGTRRPYAVTDRGASFLTITSESVLSTAIATTRTETTSTWQCAEVNGLARLTVNTTGLNARGAPGVHAAFFEALGLPLP